MPASLSSTVSRDNSLVYTSRGVRAESALGLQRHVQGNPRMSALRGEADMPKRVSSKPGAGH
jgi:hypothetical protein